MKILYHHRIRSKDGQYVHLEGLTEALEELGHEVIIIGPAAIEKAEFGSDAGIIAWLKQHLPHSIYEILEFIYCFWAYFRLRKAIALHKPDCIYERYNLFQVAGAWAKRSCRLPMLLEVNAPLFEERSKYDGISLVRFAQWSESYVWRAADYVLPVTNVLADYLRKAHVQESRIVVIPNGVNISQFNRRSDRHEAKMKLGLDGRLVLGFTGFVREWHKIEDVIQLIAKAGAFPGDIPTMHLLLVGDGPARKQIEELAHRMGVEKSITITGIIPRDEIGSYVAAFDIALQPAVVPYASPLKLFEYMALGCAIVAPATPNICEILIDSENAVLFDPGENSQFCNAVLRVCRDSSLRERIGVNAKRTIYTRGLTWENNAKRVVDLFGRLGSGNLARRELAVDSVQGPDVLG